MEGRGRGAVVGYSEEEDWDREGLPSERVRGTNIITSHTRSQYV